MYVSGRVADCINVYCLVVQFLLVLMTMLVFVWVVELLLALNVCVSARATTRINVCVYIGGRVTACINVYVSLSVSGRVTACIKCLC